MKRCVVGWVQGRDRVDVGGLRCEGGGGGWSEGTNCTNNAKMDLYNKYLKHLCTFFII